jgi:hypothetical protein
MNVTGIIALLRALGVAALDQLKQQGLPALMQALRAAMVLRRADILKKATARLKKDGDDAKLTSTESFTDRDGVVMNGRQWFVHQTLFAIPRALVGGGAADIIRDDTFAIWGLQEADTLLAGVTDPAVALQRVFDRILR